MKYKKTIIFFILFFLFLFSTPYILSTPIGKKIIVKIFQKKGYDFDAKKLKFSWLGPQEIYYLNISNKKTKINIETLLYHSNFFNLLKKKFFSKDLSFEIKNGSIFRDKITLKNINGFIKKEKLFLIKGQGDILSSENEKGFFNIDVKYKKDNYSGYIDLKNFPSIILETFKNKQLLLLKQLLGKTINIKSNFKIQNNEGPFDIVINSTNASFSFFGNYRNKEIFLQKNLIGKITNQEIQKKLKQENPIFIEISKDGFLLPIDLDIKKIKIDKAILNFGKFKIKDDTLNLIIRFLKYNSFFSPDQIDVWAAPFILRLHDGKLNIYRADFLLENSIHIFTWGIIDITNDNIKMFLGIPSYTLAKSFNIKNLPKNYTLKIPITGSMQKIKIDTKKALYQITSLKIKEKNPLFKFFNILKPKKEKNDIPQANRPFPWEG